MDSSSLEMLEFPRVRERLALCTSFSAGRELALCLQPVADADRVELLLRQSAEARRLLSLRPDFHIAEAHDVREEVERAAKGIALDVTTLLKVLQTLTAARLARSGLGRMSQELPSLWAVVRDIAVYPELEDEISRCISPTGEILDSASQRLDRLRWEIRDTRRQIQERLESVVKSKKGQASLQEPLITERNGRYVLPVKAEFKRELRGIVHDISNKGATVFIEPLEIVDVGNELRQAEIEERQEIERILASLSSAVGSVAEGIVFDVGALARLDLALAKALYAEKIGAVEPEILRDEACNKPYLKLVNARHPLLRGDAVPLSVEIGREFSILVISGPNAGGKTVALKTIGLLALMAQAGLLIPCSEGTMMPVYDDVFADIGDEQSIEQTLSTFSAHISNLARIVKSATSRSLVLLDELGISTDPEEGAALAQATLMHFLREGSTVAVTTHYSQLKALAHLTPGMRNASLEFDQGTLMPTYKLRVGMPGGSNALNIAARFGLPEDIVASARSIMSRGSQEVEAMLTDLAAEQRRLEELQACLRREELRAQELTRALEQQTLKLQEKETALLREVRDNLGREIAGLYRAIKEAEADLKRQKRRENVKRARQALEALSRQADERSRALSARLTEIRGEEKTAVEIAAGDSVRIREMDVMAKVLAVDHGAGTLEAQTGDIRLTLNLNSVERMELGVDADTERAVARPLSIRPVPLELDLRGKRADLVSAELDAYLNQAFMSHLSEVRIIHGYGTGAVRNAVRDFLRGHALVKSFRSGGQGEGGDGVTLVKLSG